MDVDVDVSFITGWGRGGEGRRVRQAVRRRGRRVSM